MQKHNFRWDRANKRTVAAHVSVEAVNELKRLAHDQSKTTDALIHEAIALLFQRHKRGVPPSLSNKLKQLGIDLG
jgi:hypothetical protein